MLDPPPPSHHSKFGMQRFGGLVRNAFKQASGSVSDGGVMDTISEDAELAREEFADMLKTIDSGLRALPATAQVAKQEGEYLARVFEQTAVQQSEPIPEDTLGAFRYAMAMLAVLLFNCVSSRKT